MLKGFTRGLLAIVILMLAIVVSIPVSSGLRTLRIPVNP